MPRGSPARRKCHCGRKVEVVGIIWKRLPPSPAQIPGASDLPGCLARGSYITSKRKGNHEKETSFSRLTSADTAFFILLLKACEQLWMISGRPRSQLCSLSGEAGGNGSNSCPRISGRERQRWFSPQSGRVRM